jgi:membrane-associated phospholipid phosphatase
MPQPKIWLIILALVVMIITAVLGLITSVTISTNQLIGVGAISAALFIAAWLPIP